MVIAKWAAFTLIGLVLGLGAAALVGLALNAVLPPFRPEDGDTDREFVPVALMYVTWALVTIIVSILAWRHLGRSQDPPRRDR